MPSHHSSSLSGANPSSSSSSNSEDDDESLSSESSSLLFSDSTGTNNSRRRRRHCHTNTPTPTPNYGSSGLLPTHHSPLSTVLEEEGRRAMIAPPHSNKEHNDKDDDDDENHNKHHVLRATTTTTTTTPSSPKRPNIHTKRACRLWITFGFVGIIAFLFGGVLDLRKASTSSSSINSPSSGSPLLPPSPWNVGGRPAYDYIIVGGGTAGIVTATSLARAFPHLSVLLLEAGTVSQRDVLMNQQQQLLQHSKGDGGAFCSSATTTTTTTERNKFDIPLLWSGIAASTMQSQDDDDDDDGNNHHAWPMDHNHIVGRGLGGSGLLNAMIYIRSLRADWQHWNLSSSSSSALWDYDQHVLRHYKALENYQTCPTANGSCLPSFLYQQQQENDQIDNTTSTTTPWTFVPDHRGTDGPITTMAAGYGATNNDDNVGNLFVRAAMAAGVPLATPGFNHNDNNRTGVGLYEYNIHHGVRDSVAQAFLGRQAWPSNLVVRTGHTVTRILTTSTGGDSKVRAHGVAFQKTTTAHSPNNDDDNNNKNGQQNQVMGEYLLTHDGDNVNTDAAAQLILSAGALLTPQLLAQSGIGPGGQVLDLPGVGANCHDHPVVALSYSLTPQMLANQAATESMYTLGNAWEEYQKAVRALQNVPVGANWTFSQRTAWHRLGTLGTAGFSAGAFLKSPWARDDNSPDIQITVFPRVFEPHVTRVAKQQADDAAAQNGDSSTSSAPKSTVSAMLVTVALLQADARYRVQPSVPLSSSEPAESDSSSLPRPNDLPANWIHFQAPRMQVVTQETGGTSYLSKKDIRRLAWGIQEVRRIFDTAPLAEQLQDEIIPGRSVQGKQLRDWINATILPNAHWVGTSKMGSADDPMAVVDETLLVRGTTNLRIVDAGVIPSAPNGNTHSTVTVVASRGAELIAEARRQASLYERR